MTDRSSGRWVLGRLLNRRVFRDPPVPLTERQEWDARYQARRAARQARSSARTARGQYRRYRAALDGAPYLDWPRWRIEYFKTYRDAGVPIRPTDGTPPGVSPS